MARAQERHARFADTPDEDAQRGQDGEREGLQRRHEEDGDQGDHGEPEIHSPQVPQLAHLADLHHARDGHDDDGAKDGLRQGLEERRQEERDQGGGAGGGDERGRGVRAGLVIGGGLRE